MNDIKELLLEAPDTQLDSSVKPLIQKWSSPPKAVEVLEVVDTVVFGSLGSDFTVNVLNFVLQDAIIRENISESDLSKLAIWRKDL